MPNDLSSQLAVIMENSKGAINEIADAVEEGVGQGALMIAGRAKEIITENKHIRTGNLLRSIQGLKERSGLQVIGKIGTDVHYAVYVEALPDGGYLYRAFKEKIRDVNDLIISKAKEATK